MADFPVDKQLIVGADDAARQADALTIAKLEAILNKQEALEYVQKAIAACTTPSTTPTLAAINTAIAAEMIP